MLQRSRFLIGAAVLMAACGSDNAASASPSDAPTIAVSTSIWADVVSNVACDGIAKIETLIPTGGDPHTFEPSLADRASMEDASLIVVNGLGLEEGLTDTIEAVEASGTRILRVGQHVGNNVDPHVWFDPQLVAASLPHIAERLVDSAGANSAAIDACVAAYEAELALLDADITELVATLPDDRRKLVTDHNLLGYLIDRHDFELVGTISPTTPAHLEELAVAMEEEGATAIFADSAHSTNDAEALANRLGDAQVVTIAAGGNTDTYIEWLRGTIETIIDALRG